jgi:hypothetical protein
MAVPFRHPSPSANISRLITAAVVNQGFCKLLLTNPEKAIASGYNGEAFRLDHQEKELILSIQASSLADFAIKISKQNSGQEYPSRRTRKSTFLL